MLTRQDDVDAHALRRQGWTISAIARHLGHDRKSVERVGRPFLQGALVPEADLYRCGVLDSLPRFAHDHSSSLQCPAHCFVVAAEPLRQSLQGPTFGIQPDGLCDLCRIQALAAELHTCPAQVGFGGVPVDAPTMRQVLHVLARLVRGDQFDDLLRRQPALSLTSGA
jgi:hypothetical protein